MADHPILFSPPMITALLREIERPGTGKTQTRRALNPQPMATPTGAWIVGGYHGGTVLLPPVTITCLADAAREHLPIKPADRLWCREEHFQFGHWEVDPGKRTKGGREKWRFVADRDDVMFTAPETFRKGRQHEDPEMPAWHKRLGRFMFRKHSRISLYVTDVRVERLQDIRINDALAEGVQLIPYEAAPDPGRISACWYGVPREGGGYDFEANHPAWSYGHLWDAINGPGAWAENPFVAAYTFAPRLGKIDSLPATLQEAA